MRSILLALPAFALLAACEKAVSIESPVVYPNQPVTQIKVRFSPNFKAGTFHATLDGQDITALFAPAPAPGGQSFAQIAGLECGFEEGERVTSPPPPQNPPVFVDTRPKEQSPSSGQAPAQPQPGPGTGTVSPVPPAPLGLTVFWHRILVDGGCSFGRICEGDERQFLPPHMVGVPIKLPLVVGTRQFLEVESWPPATVPIRVKVQPQKPTTPVRLNGGAQGASVSTTVLAGVRSPPIAVEGLVRPSGYMLLLCAPGTQRGFVTGPIN